MKGRVKGVIKLFGVNSKRDSIPIWSIKDLGNMDKFFK